MKSCLHKRLVQIILGMFSIDSYWERHLETSKKRLVLVGAFALTVLLDVEASASVLVDASPDGRLRGGWTNIPNNQNFLVKFTLDKNTIINGMDIWGLHQNAAHTIKFRHDVTGLPSETNFLTLSGLSAVVTPDPPSPGQPLNIYSTSFSGVLLAPGSYWIGMSAFGGNWATFNKNAAYLTPAETFQSQYQLDGDSLVAPFGTPNFNGFALAYRIRGFTVPSAVPEPSTWAMLLLGFGFIGSAMRSAKRRNRVSVSYA